MIYYNANINSYFYDSNTLTYRSHSTYFCQQKNITRQAWQFYLLAPSFEWIDAGKVGICLKCVQFNCLFSHYYLSRFTDHNFIPLSISSETGISIGLLDKLATTISQLYYSLDFVGKKDFETYNPK